jgi:hypothetical protein
MIAATRGTALPPGVSAFLEGGKTPDPLSAHSLLWGGLHVMYAYMYFSIV